MNIRTICWARNECDILEAFVRHHAQFSDVIVVLHRCRDNSAEILQSLKNEGVPVTYSTDERLAHEQSDVLTNLMQHAFRDGADWVLPLDADEFLIGDIQSALQNTGEDAQVLRAAWKGYVPVPENNQSEKNILRRITHRRAHEHPQWYKMLIPLAVSGKIERLCCGNHQVLERTGREIVATDSPLTIAHFPVRSPKQMARKIFGGWLAYCATADQTAGGCFQWKAAYERLKSGAELTASELKTCALEYASEEQKKAPLGNDAAIHSVEFIADPVVHTFDVHYPIREIDPVQVLLDTAEDIAMAYGRLRTKFRHDEGASSAT